MEEFAYGRDSRLKGLSLKDTLINASKIRGLPVLPKDTAKWPDFVHGTEDGWFN